MPDHRDDGLGRSPKDPATGHVEGRSGPAERSGTEAEAAAQGDKTPPKSGGDTVPAGQRNSAYHGDDAPEPPGKGPGHDAEKAAAYRENDA